MSQYATPELLARLDRPTKEYTNPDEARKLKRAIRAVLGVRHGGEENARISLTR